MKRLLAILFIFALLGMSLLISPPVKAGILYQSTSATVEFLKADPNIGDLIDNAHQWAIGGGYLYWSRCNSGNEDPILGYLRRWPLTGGRVTTINENFCGFNLTADASGLYYQTNTENSWQIWRRSLGDPTTATRVVNRTAAIADFVLSNDEIVMLADSVLDGFHIYRAPQNGIDSTGILNGFAGLNVSNLIAAGDVFYWFGDNQLRSMPKGCSDNNCVNNGLVESNGDYLTNEAVVPLVVVNRASPIWVNEHSIRGQRCTVLGGCSISTVYTAPADASNPADNYRYLPAQLASDGTYLFWVEEHQRYSEGGPFTGPGYFPTDEARLMKWKLQRGFQDSDPFVTPQPIAVHSVDPNYSIGPSMNLQDALKRRPFLTTAVANGWVYFYTSQGISRIRADAPPITWDLAVSGKEITQGIQNLGVIEGTPLVANRPTYFRLYGNKLDGPLANNVSALLYGYQDAPNGTDPGTPLPGSPLVAINGTQSFTTTQPIDRTTLARSWLFQLPESWVQAGVIILEAKVDPRKAYNETNRSNNVTVSQRFRFTRKAPVCIVTIPVRTHAPTAANSDPSLYRMVDMVKRLYPIEDVWLYHQDRDVAETEFNDSFPFFPPWIFGPYEIPEDNTEILNALAFRGYMTDDPDECDDIGAVTHYVGLVHANSPTNVSSDAEALGLGRVNSDVLWIKLIKPEVLTTTPDDTQLQRFNVLAHEVAHNYGRRHVGCTTEGNPDSGYPYTNRCLIDDRALNNIATYFGFDTVLQRPIAPDSVADYMAYREPYWTSDYTYKALYAAISTRPNAQTTLNAAGVDDLLAASNVLYLSGVVTPTSTSGTLDYGWVFPTNTLSQGILRKLQGLTTSRLSEVSAAEEGNYHIRLLDVANAVLDDRAVTLLETSDNEPNAARSFNLTLATPTTAVAKVELLDGTTVLATLQPGTNPPTVTILSPAGGEQFDEQMPLSWRATDADSNDRLLFTVQYSPDNGQSWQAIVTGFPNLSGTDTATLNLQRITGLAGSTSNGGLIRVAASDGYHTTLSTSLPFTLANHHPTVVIYAPTPYQTIAAGGQINLRGSATDPEEGGLSDNSLRWTLEGTEAGTGQESSLAGLAPGDYSVVLTAQDSLGNGRTVSTTFTVAPLAIPQANAPTVDGSCDDPEYANAQSLSLKPYTDHSQATVQLMRSANQLWACFSGLQRASSPTVGSFVSLRVDTNLGRDATPQADDRELRIAEDGVMGIRIGNSNGWQATDTTGLEGRVSANEDIWSAELSIDANTIGGWDHVIGLMVGQQQVASDNDQYAWPYNSVPDAPVTWAKTLLGTPTTIENLEPVSATVGSTALVLTVNGDNFANGAVVQWNGSARPTTFVSNTQLQAQISVEDFLTPGTVTIKVVPPEQLGSALSNGLPFVITDINKQDQTVFFAPLRDHNLSDPPFTLSATADSGLPVSFSSSTVTICTVNGNTVKLVAAGDCSITASQTGNATYNSAPPITQTFKVAGQGQSTTMKVYLPVVSR